MRREIPAGEERQNTLNAPVMIKRVKTSFRYRLVTKEDARVTDEVRRREIGFDSIGRAPSPVIEDEHGAQECANQLALRQKHHAASMRWIVLGIHQLE